MQAEITVGALRMLGKLDFKGWVREIRNSGPLRSCVVGRCVSALCPASAMALSWSSHYCFHSVSDMF